MIASDRLRIHSFSVSPSTEVITKVSKEVLTLFRIEVNPDAGQGELRLCHKIAETSPALVETELCLIMENGESECFHWTGKARPDEAFRAAVHRLVKLNFYQILRQYFDMPPAPWGILYGVRPTKIVQRFLDAGLSAREVAERFTQDYEASQEKAALITDVALYQRPFLQSAKPKDISIYVGIPFCLSRCLYCSFPSVILPPKPGLKRFMAVFHKDLEAVLEAVRHYGFKVQNIYVGGGTPTSLPEDVFAEMLETVHDAFYHPAVKEFTVEAGRPDSMTAAKIQTMRKCHVDRVSVNPQTMQQRTLQRIGRFHTPEDILQMYGDLREAEIPCINMDVIIGLPGETVDDVSDTMEKVLALKPDDVTLHSLALKKGSRLKLHLDEISLPEDGEVRKMFDEAMRAVCRQGLIPYYLYRQGYQSGQLENIGCCRPGAESMYNIQIMEEKQTILGIGGAAVSKIVSPSTHRLKASFNPKEITVYLDQCDHYIEKRASLLREAYGEQEETVPC